MKNDALTWAETQVEAVREDPKARLHLIDKTYLGPVGYAPKHLPFRRAALSFMRWQVSRGVLNPVHAKRPGSLWWRAMNDRLLRDGCESVALVGDLSGSPSSHAVQLWLEFIDQPTAHNWYRAHNSSIVEAYIKYRDLADKENIQERFFMNVVLERVLFAHALVANPRFALGRFAFLGRILGDPRLGMAGAFLSLGRVLPKEYPLELEVKNYIADEHSLGRLLDYAVIGPKMQQLYEWSAEELNEPGLLEMIQEGNPIYAWSFAERNVWKMTHMPIAARFLQTLLRAQT